MAEKDMTEKILEDYNDLDLFHRIRTLMKSLGSSVWLSAYRHALAPKKRSGH
jgi:hypothetical protein